MSSQSWYLSKGMYVFSITSGIVARMVGAIERKHIVPWVPYIHSKSNHGTGQFSCPALLPSFTLEALCGWKSPLLAMFDKTLIIQDTLQEKQVLCYLQVFHLILSFCIFESTFSIQTNAAHKEIFTDDRQIYRNSEGYQLWIEKGIHHESKIGLVIMRSNYHRAKPLAPTLPDVLPFHFQDRRATWHYWPDDSLYSTRLIREFRSTFNWGVIGNAHLSFGYTKSSHFWSIFISIILSRGEILWSLDSAM